MTDIDRELATSFLKAIIAERHRAHEKHGATSMEQAPALDPWRGLILGKEALECGKALNDDRHGAIRLFRGKPNHPGPLVLDDLDKELIQTAAMAYTWWANRRGDRLPFDPPMPEVEERCAWTHEGRRCGMRRNAHSRTRMGGFLVGHEFVEPTVDEQIASDLRIYGCAFEQMVDGVKTRLDPTTITMRAQLQGGEPYLVRKPAEVQTMPLLETQ